MQDYTGFDTYAENKYHDNFLIIIFGRRRNIKYHKKYNNIDDAYIDFYKIYNNKKNNFCECDDREVKKNKCEFMKGAFDNDYGLMYLYKLSEDYVNNVYVKYTEYYTELSPIEYNYVGKKDKVIVLNI
jgi:hypothetical protein